MTGSKPREQQRPTAFRGRIAPLDGVRGIGIVLVLVGHSFQNTLGTALGTFGVNSFFVLSGFLITSLLLQEREREGKIDLRAFYVRRIRRIFPAYYVFLGVIAIASAIGILHVDARALAYDALYLRNYSFGIPADWWTGHTWSLAVEEQFYLIWPAVLVFGGVRLGWKFIAACIVGAPLLRVAVYAALPAYRPYIEIMLPTHIDTLMFGCGIGTMFVLRSRFLGWFTSRRAELSTALLTLGVIVGFALELKFKGEYRLPVGLTVEGLASSALILYLVEYPTTATARLLSWAPLAWLGRLSYSLYLWQQVFVTPHHLNATVAGRFPFDIVAAVATAAASYYLVEKRFFKPKPLQAPGSMGRTGLEPATPRQMTRAERPTFSTGTE